MNIAIGGTAAADKNTLTDTDPNNADDVFLDTQSDYGAPTFINLYRNGSTASGATNTEALYQQILVDDNTGPLDLIKRLYGQLRRRKHDDRARRAAQRPAALFRARSRRRLQPTRRSSRRPAAAAPRLPPSSAAATPSLRVPAPLRLLTAGCSRRPISPASSMPPFCAGKRRV